MTGTVIRNTGSWYTVRPDADSSSPDNADIACKIKGNFRLKGIRTTNPVAVGDRVEVSTSPDGSAYITKILPRKNYIIRRSSNLSKEAHIIAANVDQALLVATLFHPVTSTTFIDRFLATAEAYRIPALIVFNKTDLCKGDSDREEYLEAITYLYNSIGYRVIHTSATSGEGLDALRTTLTDKTSLLSGNSGVGKTTLINDLIPGLNLRTAPISDIHDTGMHTTTFSEMFALPDSPNSFIIDTPGVKGFGTVDFDSKEVSHFFPEIFETGKQCRFNDCSHTHEPGCAVRDALAEQRIAQSRYASYLSILRDDTQGKYREAF